MGLWGIPFRSCVLGSLFKFHDVAPSCVTFWGDCIDSRCAQQGGARHACKWFRASSGATSRIESCILAWLQKIVGRVSLCRRPRNHDDMRKGRRGERQLVSLVGASWQNYYTSWRTNGKSRGDAVKTASSHEAECFTCSWPPLFNPAGGAHSTHMLMYTGLLSSTASIAKCRGKAGQLQVKAVRRH